MFLYNHADIYTQMDTEKKNEQAKIWVDPALRVSTF